MPVIPACDKTLDSKALVDAINAVVPLDVGIQTSVVDVNDDFTVTTALTIPLNGTNSLEDVNIVIAVFCFLIQDIIKFDRVLNKTMLTIGKCDL